MIFQCNDTNFVLLSIAVVIIKEGLKLCGVLYVFAAKEVSQGWKAFVIGSPFSPLLIAKVGMEGFHQNFLFSQNRRSDVFIAFVYDTLIENGLQFFVITYFIYNICNSGMSWYVIYFFSL